MPGIGMRMIKSAVSVFLCFVIYLIRGQGMPFYSAIAAMLCMQQDLSDSISAATNRVLGTIIGGLCGMGLLLLERAYLPTDLPALQYLLVSATLIPLMYLTVLLKKTPATYITCVVFMSVAVSHGADVNPYLFALNRIIDTLIGICVSLAVNSAHLLRRRDLESLYVTHLERSLTGGRGEIGTYGKVKLNQLLDCGAKIMVLSEESPERFLPMLAGVKLKLPVIAFNGAAIYHMDKNAYTDCVPIPRSSVLALEVVFAERGRGCFVGAVLYDVLHVFYTKFSNQFECDEYESRRKTPYRQYVCGPLPDGRSAIFITAIDRTAAAEGLCTALRTLPCADGLTITTYPYGTDGRWEMLEIRAAAATPENAVGVIMNQVKLPHVLFLAPGEGNIPIKALVKRFHQGKAKPPKTGDTGVAGDTEDAGK